MQAVAAEPKRGRIEWVADYGSIVLIGVLTDDGVEHTVYWDHRCWSWFEEDYPEPVGLLVEITEDGVAVVE